MRKLTVEQQAVRNAVDDAKCADCGGLRYGLTLTTPLRLRPGEHLFPCGCHAGATYDINITLQPAAATPERDTPATQEQR